MANEIRITAGLQMANGNDSLAVNTIQAVDQAAQGHIDLTVECVGGVGSKQAISLTGLATGAHVCFIRNLSTSGSLYISETAKDALIELGPNEPAVFRLVSGITSLDIWDDGTASAGVMVRVVVLEV